jgi:hypothetical protein
LKFIKGLFLWIIFSILALALFFAAFALLGFIQEKLFVPKDYILWIFKYPVSRLSSVFLFYVIFFHKKAFPQSGQFEKRHKKWFYPLFAFANLLLVYVLLFNVCVITNNSIVNRSFLFPQGRTYNYSDIVSINTGVYAEKKWHLPFADKSGTFYYIITLKDGTKINLNGDAGGTRNDLEMNGVFEDIDKSFVKMGIKKTANTDNFELLEKNLDKIYSDKIKNILTNVK